MKTLVLLMLCTVAFGEEFRVSRVKADKTKLEEIFGEVRGIELQKNAPPTYRMQVLSKVNESNYLVILPSQNRRIFWLQLARPRGFADDDWLELSVTETGQTKEYTAVSGAKKTVYVLLEAELDPPDPMTKEEFVERLKNGETWTLKRYVRTKCRTCFGDGQLSSTSGGGKCPDCRGQGSFVEDLTVRW